MEPSVILWISCIARRKTDALDAQVIAQFAQAVRSILTEGLDMA